ncbi:thiamine pyrophosphate protein TPP binding domain protein [Methanocaldococcus villosus KIN24-T80]|uniref:Thiamine pyrophosphate protein TPP binding domain protein n=1 Tax=Methanocaldococcus villosus KIN24-T80 TaxID=1069083 RepID=N6V1G9_9EURY|nr:thiamine pyrophosphate-binding protein [Methanocaldococcus villosus]ENN96113.1 thiamine pyrophosphate protein TPP binding domain protein [Methanocaldococcus villosus KIN24-T80]
MKFLEAIVDFLERNIKTLFYYPGEQVLPLCEEVENSKINNILAGDERGAGFMAEGYARITNYIGVAISSTPGAGNLVTPALNAYKDNSSILLITGRNYKKYRGENYFQEIDMNFLNIYKGYFDPKYEDFVKAFYECLYSRRPIHINISLDCYDKEVEVRDYIKYKYNYNFNIDIESRKPLLLIGQGIYGLMPYKDIIKINKILKSVQIPISTTFPARGVISENSDNCIGLVGRRGDIKSLLEADKIINIGSSLSYNTYVESVRNELLKKTININFYPNDIKEVKELFNNISLDNLWFEKELYFTPKGDYSKKIYTLISSLPDDAIIVNDAGKHTVFTCLLKKCYLPKSLIASHSFGCMGFSLPTAIGVKLACLDYGIDREVVSINGDGSFIMNLQELKVISENNLKILIVIFENHKLGRFKTINNPNFVKIAESFNIDAYKTENYEEIEDVVKGYLRGNKPLLLSIKTEDEDLPTPNR